MSLASRRQRGFTLLELIVGMTLFSMIAVALYSAFRLGVRSWETGEARAAGTEEIRLVEGFIRDYLGKAVPVWGKQGRRTELQFEGRENALRFVAEMPPHAGLGGLYELSLAVTGTGERRQLSLTRRLFHPDLDELLDGNEEELRGILDARALVEAVDVAKFAYYGSTKPREKPAWQDSWTDARKLPEMIRLRVSTRDSGTWPELVVKPRVNGVPSQKPEVGAPAGLSPELSGAVMNLGER